MQATATSDLSTVFLALRHELADWASASERLESVLGDILEGHALNANEMEGVQALDSLSQHLRQLAQLCGDLGAEPLPVDHETGDRVRKVCERPAWIRGIDHRVEPHALGARDLTVSVSTRLAGEKAGVGRGRVDVAELHAPFTHQEWILREALGLGDGVSINPSGGALAAHSMMAAGLVRIGEAARRIHEGEARRAVAHATSGPCLQQNLVCVLEGE